MVTFFHQLYLPSVIWLQSTPSRSFYLKYILILSPQLSLCLQSECRSFTFPYQKLVCNSLHFQKVICPAHLTLLDMIISIVFLENKLWRISRYNFLHLPVTSSLLRTISLLPTNSRIFWITRSSRCSVEKWWRKVVSVLKKPRHEAVSENEGTDPHIHNLCNIWGECELHVPATLAPNFSMHWSEMGLWTGLDAKGTRWIFHSAGNGSPILWIPSTSPWHYIDWAIK